MQISQVIGPRTSTVVTAPDPVPGSHQVVVEVLASGICTSDVSVWTTGGSPGSPVRLGHEIVGRVHTVGSQAGRWKEGDVVTGLGGEGFASRALLDSSTILPVPAGLDPTVALGEPLADLEEALARTGLRPGQTVAVVGLGFMGLGLLQLARTRAPGLIVGVDPSAAARERALALGADLVFDPADLPERYRSDTGRETESRLDVVLEATGVTDGLSTAGTLVRPFGTLCVVGYHHSGTAKLDLDLWYKAVTIVNGFCPDRTRLIGAMADALELAAARRISLETLVTHRFRLDQIDDAYELMTARDDRFVKGIVIF